MESRNGRKQKTCRLPSNKRCWNNDNLNLSFTENIRNTLWSYSFSLIYRMFTMFSDKVLLTFTAFPLWSLPSQTSCCQTHFLGAVGRYHSQIWTLKRTDSNSISSFILDWSSLKFYGNSPPQPKRFMEGRFNLRHKSSFSGMLFCKVWLIR